MSIVLQGSTSGSVTLQEPAVAGTTVLTLPAVSGTVLTTTSPKAGNVLQVVQNSTVSQESTNSGSFVATSITASITPTSASSKILVLISVNASNQNNSRAWGGAIYRNSTNVSDSGILYTSGGGDIWASLILQHLDSPATTSSTSYTLYQRVVTGSGAVFVGWGSPFKNIITLMEIAG